MILLAAATIAAAGCSAGGEYEPPLCPAHLPAVATVRIDEQAAQRWPPAQEPPCRTFRLTQADVRRFLRDARAADPRDVHHTLPESACVARGRVRFAGGGTGRWQVDRFALGWLERPGHARLTLYCPRCRGRPWMQ